MKFSKPLLITRLKATGVHLSLVVFIYLVYQIYFNWYPQPYFSVDGGWQGIRLIAGVDLVLGPLITFMIFDLSKSRREIVLALMIIAPSRSGLASALKSKQVVYMSRMGSRQQQGRFDSWLEQHSQSVDEVLVAPFSGRYGNVWLVFDLEGNYLDYF